jgi:hypothetical protein
MDHALNADNTAYALDGRGQKPLEVPPSKRESEAVPSLFRALRCAGPLKLIPVCSPFGYLINHAMTAPTKCGGLISSLLVVWTFCCSPRLWHAASWCRNSVLVVAFFPI